MTYRQHIGALLTLGLPLIGSHVAQILMQTTDTVMLGRYDVEALAALVLATTLYMVIFLFLSGFSWAVVPLVSAAAEQDDAAQIRRATRMGLWLSLAFGVLGLPVLLFSGPLLALMGQEEALSEGAQTYLRIMGWGLLPGLGVMVLKSYLSGLERTRVQLWVTLGAAIANVGLNWVLIFGKLGAPELGIRGAAIASLSLTIMSFVVLAIYVLRRFPHHAIFNRLWRPDWSAARHVFSMGWQIGITTLAEVGLFSAASIMMGWISTAALAAHGIALQVVTLSFMVQLGLSNAVTVRAGRAFGRGDMGLLRRGLGAAHMLGLGFAVLCALLYFTVPQPIIGLFLDDADPLRGEILILGAGFLLMGGLFQLVDSSQVLSVAALRGMQDTSTPMWIAALSYWAVGAPAAYALGFWADMGGRGIWLGLVIGLGTAAIAMMIRFRSHTAR